MIDYEPKHPVPAILSFFVPGLGQMIKGELGRGIGFFLGVLFTFPFIVPPLLIWLINIHDAYHRNPPTLVSPNPVIIQIGSAPSQSVPSASQSAEETALPPRPRMGARKFWGTVLLAGALAGLSIALAHGVPWWPSFLGAGIPLSLGGLLWWTALRREGEWQEEKRQAKERQGEREILRCAQRYGGRVTAPQVAMETSLSLDEVKDYLDRMSAQGHVGISITESGALVYEFYEFADEQEQVRAERLLKPVDRQEERLWEELQEGEK